MLQCKDVTEEASNYLNRDLPLRKRIGLFLHLVICSCCRHYLQQMRQTIGLVKSSQPKEQHTTDTKALANSLSELAKKRSQ